MNLDNEWGRVFARRWLRMIAADVPKKLRDLEKVLVKVREEEPIVKARIKQGDYTNLKVISLLSAEDDDGGGDAPNLDEMTLKELRAFVKEKDLEIDGYRKLDEDELRDAIEKNAGGGGDDKGGDDKKPEFDDMDKDDLLEFIKENEIDHKDLGFKTSVRMKKAEEDDLRDKVIEHVEAQEAVGTDKGGGADDELLEEAKVFCGTWKVTIGKDADLDDIKKALNGCEFPEEECEADDIKLLKAVGCEASIIKKKASTRRSRGK